MKAVRLCDVSRQLSGEVRKLRFGPPVTHVYDPLDYARAPHEAYLQRYGRAPKRVLLLGMNPGPFGMAQTGIPFGDVAMVRDWLRIVAPVGRPRHEHPRRPVLGFDCPRREVSGSRLWGWARDVFGTPDCFFSQCFVANYCPLVFMDSTGRNHTPDKLAVHERQRLYAACDRALRAVVALLGTRIVVGVGSFAAGRAREALADQSIRVVRLTHPSPANPRAHRGWADDATRCMKECGVQPPPRAAISLSLGKPIAATKPAIRAPIRSPSPCDRSRLRSSEQGGLLRCPSGRGPSPKRGVAAASAGSWQTDRRSAGLPDGNSRISGWATVEHRVGRKTGPGQR